MLKFVKFTVAVSPPLTISAAVASSGRRRVNDSEPMIPLDFLFQLADDEQNNPGPMQMFPLGAHFSWMMTYENDLPDDLPAEMRAQQLREEYDSLVAAALFYRAPPL